MLDSQEGLDVSLEREELADCRLLRDKFEGLASLIERAGVQGVARLDRTLGEQNSQAEFHLAEE